MNYLPLPRTVHICVNAEKGGPGKTTVALNLASFLGRKGFSVVLMDQNESPDATKDVFTLANQYGLESYFEIVMANGEGGNPRASELFPRLVEQNVAFVISDTAQFLRMEKADTLWALQNCDLFITPVTPEKQDQPKFEAGIANFLQARKDDTPCIVWPSKTRAGATGKRTMAAFQDFLDRLALLKNVLTPQFEHTDFLDYNESLIAREVRLVIPDKLLTFPTHPPEKHAELKGQFLRSSPHPTPRILNNLEKHYAWIIEVIIERFGAMPPRQGHLSSLSVIEQLAPSAPVEVAS